MFQFDATKLASCTDIARAIGLVRGHVFAVGGGPVTHIVELVAAHVENFEWSVNEKTALEAAVGLSAAGGRSVVIMKHNGLSFALDSLTNTAVHTLGAGLVIVVGDDTDASRSTCMNDSRALARCAGVPVLEPIRSQDAPGIIGAAVRLSERLSSPVVVRVTSAIHMECVPGVALPPSQEGPPTFTYRRINTVVAHGLTKLGRHQRHRLIALPTAVRELAEPRYAGVACLRPCRESAIIAVGSAARYAEKTRYCLLTVQGSWPVPSEVVSFVNCHQRVLVLEEPTPFLEHILREEIAAKARLLGRLTGHLPPEGELCAELVVQTLSGRPASEEWTHIACKPPGEAPLGRYEILYRAVSWIRSEGVFVATDVGSSVRLCYPPYSGADVALCLGSAISVAGGAARTGRTSLGVIGDFAFLHSGMEALLELAAHQLRVLVVVLSNGVQAQTGGQPVSPLDTQALARALGIPIVADWELADLTAESAYAGMHDLLSGSLPAVLLVRDENTPNSALP